VERALPTKPPRLRQEA